MRGYMKFRVNAVVCLRYSTVTADNYKDDRNAQSRELMNAHTQATAIIDSPSALWEERGPIRVQYSLVCIYACMVTHIARVWINRVRLPALLVVS